MSQGGKGAGDDAGGGVEPMVMRRLVDEAAVDPLTARGWAVGLLRRTAPHRAPVGRKQRVRLALGQGGRRRALPLLRTAIAGVVLVGFGAAASAALGRWPEIVQAYHRLLAPSSSSSAIAAREPRARRATAGQLGHVAASPASPEMAAAEAVPAQASPAVEPPAVAAPIAAAAEAPSPAVTPSSVPAPEPPSASRASLHGSSASWRPRRASHATVAIAATTKTRAGSKAPPAPSAASPSPVSEMTEDTTPVLEAMRALRVEANPVRARRLLAGYLDRYPNGSLAEEALAMTIEAAVAHGDGDASVLARKYVRRYPAGHFSTMVRRTLDGAAGTAN